MSKAALTASSALSVGANRVLLRMCAVQRLPVPMQAVTVLC